MLSIINNISLQYFIYDLIHCFDARDGSGTAAVPVRHAVPATNWRAELYIFTGAGRQDGLTLDYAIFFIEIGFIRANAFIFANIWGDRYISSFQNELPRDICYYGRSAFTRPKRQLVNAYDDGAWASTKKLMTYSKYKCRRRWFIIEYCITFTSLITAEIDIASHASRLLVFIASS